jgi:nicotinate (nicotinamide) nucleotide adenylyltransferase
MVSGEHRLNMCKLASMIDGRIKIFDYEIKNKLSGETYNLVKRLKMETELIEKYKFSMIIGLDNANTFDHWVNYEELERLMSFVVIPRKGYIRDEKVDWYLRYPHIYLNDENKIVEISSTEIRTMLKSFYTENKIKYDDFLKYLNKDVLDYILEHELYK